MFRDDAVCMFCGIDGGSILRTKFLELRVRWPGGHFLFVGSESILTWCLAAQLALQGPICE